VTDIGDLLVPQLLVTPSDGTTAATLDVTTPAGVTTAHTVATTDGGHTWRGTTAITFTASRWWVLTWTVTGTGASRQQQRVFVRPDLATGGQTWTPTRERVAAYVPARTVEIASLSDAITGTFSDDTRPTGDQVDELIQDAVSWVLGTTGFIVTDGDLATVLADMATATAAIRAAGMVELAYPERDADLNTADLLLTQADAMLLKLDAANRAQGATDPDQPAHLPLWAFPEPVSWGDSLL
jgi:hypothetical protein